MRLSSLLAPAFLALAASQSAEAARNPKNSVLLSNVKSLTLRNGQKTSARRVSPIPQLTCIGGDAKGLYEVDVMRCKNAGSDYDDENIQWTCQASLPEEFKLGSTDVICEGYDSPDDPYILKGSCGVEYRLMLTSKGLEKYGNRKGSWGSGGGSSEGDQVSQGISVLFWVIFLGVVIWMIFKASFGEVVETPTRTFYAFRNEDLGLSQAKTTFGTGTDSPPAWKQITKWFKECEQHHPDCRRQGTAEPFIPKRLVDVQAPGDEMIRIVETGNDVQVDKYVTLSHRWGGKSDFLKLEAENRDRFTTDGISMEELPLNFQHAIQVTREFGIRYIWIDSLCIMQGTGGDFDIEGKKMHQIYRNSHCNIAAADAEHSDCGLFRERVDQDVMPASFQSDSSLQLFEQPGRWVVLPHQLWASQLLQNTLYTRAWVFQVFWECSTISACEALPLGLPRPLDTVASMDRHWRLRLQKITSTNRDALVGDADVPLEHFWKQAVRSYTKCDLTNQSDKVVAISGIATLVKDDLGGECFRKGMWEKYLHEQLAWRVVNCRNSSRVDGLRRNPTWSWTSVKGEIELANRLPAEERFYVIRNHEDKSVSFEVDPSNKSDGLEVSTSDVEKPMAMRGAVIDCRLRTLDHGTGWGLDVSANEQDNNAFEAFPDEDPEGPNKDCKLTLSAQWS
ncbi:hypothetical protein SLS58_005618 [Diplodia intermedia]|uniref:Heterokaryon incompatibility domain-containing protein n=1 Tax=Diplodia intermedia TaxID=856260 RepID=A0ABR3TQ11_9PEZI